MANGPTPSTSRADYGLDAPGLVRGFLLGGIGLLLASLALTALAPGIGLARAAFWMGFSFAATGALMLASSRFGKLRARDRLLDRLALRGSERVLDVGCGRGLLLIGAARRLPRGETVGIDLWSQRDLSANSADATLDNARIEGVAGRVTVRDGDMRELPFEDGSFDAVVSFFAIHNVAAREGRRRAVQEIARVLAPDGRVALQDLGRTAQYARDLRAAGLTGVRRSFFSAWTFPPSRVVTARKGAPER